MANNMQTKSKPSKKGPLMFKAGPNMMPHKGGKDCRCPNCKDKRK